MIRYQASAALSRRVGAASVALALGVSRLPAVLVARARAARTASVNDTGHLRLLNASGAVLNEAGPVSGNVSRPACGCAWSSART